MNRLITAVASTLVVLVCLLPAPALAQTDMPAGEHLNGGVGFHNVEAPLGVRWWLAGQKVGFDVGLGFRSTPAPSYANESLTGWTIEVGVPICMKTWSRAHVLFRPGFIYDNQQFEGTTPPTPFDTVEGKTLAIAGEIEVEVFLVENISVSASTGLGFASFDPPGGGDNITTTTTFGNNFTNIGFHAYIFGGK